MLLFKSFLSGNYTSASGEFALLVRKYFCHRRICSSWLGILLPQEGFFHDQERKISKIPEVFLTRKSLASDNHRFPANR
jgi:hypothetical protein